MGVTYVSWLICYIAFCSNASCMSKWRQQHTFRRSKLKLTLEKLLNIFWYAVETIRICFSVITLPDYCTVISLIDNDSQKLFWGNFCSRLTDLLMWSWPGNHCLHHSKPDHSLFFSLQSFTKIDRHTMCWHYFSFSLWYAC